MAHDDVLPLQITRKVTREEFQLLECNRCGVCCERIHMPSPLVLAQELGRYYQEKALWPPEAIEALGLQEAMLDRERLIDWWSEFVPIARVEEPGKPLQYQYRCSRFYRDEEGAASCTAYDSRPSTCRSFPNGKPMTDISACSWNVQIID